MARPHREGVGFGPFTFPAGLRRPGWLASTSMLTLAPRRSHEHRAPLPEDGMEALL